MADSSNNKSRRLGRARAHRVAAAVGRSQLDSSSLALQVEGDRALLTDLGQRLTRAAKIAAVLCVSPLSADHVIPQQVGRERRTIAERVSSAALADRQPR